MPPTYRESDLLPQTGEATAESKEIAELRSTFEQFCQQVVDEELRGFWERRPINPELNGNGVTQDELLKRVIPRFRKKVRESLPSIKLIVDASPDKDRTLEAIFSVMFPIIARTQLEEGFDVITNIKKTGIDTLTGLPNRKVYDRNLRACVRSYERHGHTFSMLMIDLDHFKSINDRYGHQAGDMVLQEFARRIKEDVKLRELDAVMRIGGEEFALILRFTSKKGACIVADRIQEQLRKAPFLVIDKEGKEQEIEVRASIGVAEYEYVEEMEQAKGGDVHRRADIALYVAKGEVADENEVSLDRRNSIVCDKHIVTDSDIASYKEEFVGKGRSSFPAPKRRQ